jgi:hypothetical protein
LTTFALLKQLAPELSSESPSRANIFLDIAKNQVVASVWGDRYTNGVLLLAAHFMTLANRKGVGGPVTGLSAGDMSISYGSTQAKSDLANTSYGLLYLELRKLNPVPVTVTN